MRASIPAALLLLALVGLGLRLRLSDRPAVARAIGWLLPLAGLMAAALTFSAILNAPYRPWNDPRLAPSMLLFAGDLYAPLDRGPLVGHIYGPVSPLVFAPALLLPTPGLAVAAGVLLAFLVVSAPAAFVFALEGRGQARLAALACLAFWLYAHVSWILGITFVIHADAPAMGCGALACALVYTSDQRRRPLMLALSALAVAASVGSKQVMIPLAVVLPLWILTVEGWPAARRYVLVSAGVAAATLTALFVVIDLETMILNTIVVPGAHPLKPDGWMVLATGVTRDLAPRAFPFVLVLALVVWFEWRADGRPASWREWCRSHPWVLFLGLAVACVPFALLGRAVTGASINPLAFPLYFVEIAALLALLRLARRRGTIAGVVPRPAVAFALAIAVTWLAVLQVPALARLPDVARAFRDNPEDQAFALVRDRPGQVYLPFKPLVSLMAEGAAYHFSVGVSDRNLAGLPVSESHFRAHMPPRLTYVAAWDVDIHTYFSMWYLPEFGRQVPIDGLDRWTVLTRDDQADGTGSRSGP